MNISASSTTVQKSAKPITLGLAGAFALTFLIPSAHAVPVVNLGSASGFAVLAGSKITDAGGSSAIANGNVGLYPTTGAAIGLTAGQVVGGTIYTAETSGALLNGAQNDLTTAYNDAASRPVTVDFGVVDNQLGGQTLFPGVYRFGHAATANLIGTLTLDANGELNPVWIFQATSDFITSAGAPDAAGSSVALINGANACDVFWQVGSSATIGTYSDFVGHIMADQSISLQAYATLDGSAMARIAAVTLDHNIITSTDCSAEGGDNTGSGSNHVPETTGTFLLLGTGLAGIFPFSQSMGSRR